MPAIESISCAQIVSYVNNGLPCEEPDHLKYANGHKDMPKLNYFDQ